MKHSVKLVAIMMLICALLTVSVTASDMKTGKIYDEDNCAEIVALEENILSDLYASSLSGKSAIPPKGGIDFGLAQEVFTFTPEKFLDIVMSEDFLDLYASEGTSIWKVPVCKSSASCDYATIGKGQDNSYEYTTVSLPSEGVKSIEYLFYPENVNSIMREKRVDGQIIAILSIPLYNLDLITVRSNNDTILFIPYTNSWVDLQSGDIYSKDIIVKAVEEMVAQEAIMAEDEGGIGQFQETSNFDGMLRLALLCIVTIMVMCICVKKWNKYLKESK